MITLALALAAGVTLGVATARAAHAAPGCTTDTALVTTCAFGYTGSWQAWTVPPGVGEATFTVVGAAGGWADHRPGGRGGGVVGTMAVAPGETLRLFVGGKGGSDTDAPAAQGLGGWNGGGNGAGPLNPGGGGGGGASDVRRAPYSTDDRVIVGGGGGGAGSAITYGNAPHGIPGAGGAGGGTGDGSQGQNVSGAWVGAGGGGGGTATAVGGGGGPSNPVDGLYNGCGSLEPRLPHPR